MARNQASDSSPSWRGSKLLGCMLGGICVVGFCLAARYYQGSKPAHADPGPAPSVGASDAAAPVAPQQQDSQFRPAPSSPRFSPPAYGQAPAYPQTQGYGPAPGRKVTVAPAQSTSPTEQLKIVAVVNGESITREDLARDCLQHYGKDVLDRLVNKYLVMQECERRGLSVSREEVNAEIERTASKFKLPVHEWLKLLKQERGVTAEQYASDIVWPRLALQKLAGAELNVTEAEIQRAYDSQYGEAVKARMIVCNDAHSAEQVRAAAVAAPDTFGDLAKRYSKDVASAAQMGQLREPIHHFQGAKEIELVAFTMKEGEISKPVKVGDQYVILKCEARLQASANVPLEKVKMGLNEMIRENKMRRLASEIFRRLQTQGQVVKVLNDPAQSRAHPGVAAIINGHAINLSELAQVCIDRHGQEALEGTINRRLLEQACKRQKVAVTAADMDQEIARAAAAMLPLKDGAADVPLLIEKITKEQGITAEIYRADSVWPSVVLKKLVGDKVEVTQEDMQKGFDSNFGPRARIRAIILNNQRRAQQVWELARKELTEDNFGDLAEKYSIEAASRTLRGEVPPVQKWSGQPTLEKAAFALKKGDLSPILDMGRGQYVILYGLGPTQPTSITFDEVKQQIYDDIHEKKLRLKMADYFQKLQDDATVDNYLAGTSRTPKRSEMTRAEPASYQAPMR